MNKEVSALNKPSKILLLGSQMETGGAQRSLLNQAEWFHKHGHVVSAAFLYDKEGLADKWQAEYPFPIVELKARRWGAGRLENLLRLMRGVGRAYALIKRGKFDAIETFTHHANLVGMPLAWLAGVPVRMASHRGRFQTLTQMQARLHAWVINSPMTTYMVANSQGTSRQALKEGIHKEKVHIIPNGIAIKEAPPGAREDVRRELCMKKNDPLVLAVGRLRYEKGHIYLLQAGPAVLRRVPRARFALAGDGTLRRELEEEAHRLGIEDRVNFLGTREDTARLMAAADVFALPSRSEGMPNALLEAMGIGCAVVATRNGGAEEVIRDGVNGLLVEGGEAEGLAGAITRLLGDDSERQRLGEAARNHILEAYSLDAMCRHYARLLIQQSWMKENGFSE